MIENPAWRCGHPETRENTTNVGKCRTCFNAYHRAWDKRRRDDESPAERHYRYRINYLPRQIEATEHKLVMLRNEAARLGLRDLLPGHGEQMGDSYSPAAGQHGVNGCPSFPGGRT